MPALTPDLYPPLCLAFVALVQLVIRQPAVPRRVELSRRSIRRLAAAMKAEGKAG